MKNRNAKMALDALLTVLLVAAMLVQLTGVIAHEVIGVVFLVLIVAHIVNSFSWMRGTAQMVESAEAKKGQLSLFIVAVLLGIDCAVLAVSSVPISRLLYQAGLAPKVMSSMWLNVHKVSSYMLCILAVVHLAMHWASILKHLNIPFDPGKRAAIGRGVTIAAGVGSVALGVVGFNSLELFTGTDVAEAGAESPASATSKGSAGSGAGTTAGSASAGSSSSAASSGSAASSSTGSASAPGAASSASGANASGSAGSSGTSASDSAASDADESEPSNEDLANTPCPLCKKHCPLSDPQCDKPYLAGLIK